MTWIQWVVALGIPSLVAATISIWMAGPNRRNTEASTEEAEASAAKNLSDAVVGLNDEYRTQLAEARIELLDARDELSKARLELISAHKDIATLRARVTVVEREQKATRKWAQLLYAQVVETGVTPIQYDPAWETH